MKKFLLSTAVLGIVTATSVASPSISLASSHSNIDLQAENVEETNDFSDKLLNLIDESLEKAREKNPDASEEEIRKIAAEIFHSYVKQDNKKQRLTRSSDDDYYDQPTSENQVMTPNVRKVYDSNPIYSFQMLLSGKVALEKAKKKYRSSELIDGIGDAYRHGYWMAAGTYFTTVDYAKRFGDAWEKDHPGTKLAEQMDQHNNAIGRIIGDSAYSMAAVVDGVDENLKAGTFVYIKDGRLVRTNQ